MLVPILALSVLIEWLMYLTPVLWNVRRYVVSVPLVMAAFATAGLAVSGWEMWHVFLIFVVVFRIINLLRVAQGRMHEAYLKRTTRRTGFLLGLFQLLLLFVADYIDYGLTDALPVLVMVQLAAAAVILFVTSRNLMKSRHREALENFSDKELPTVTVAIPARNETEDLEDCLRSMLANNYPKFEVLVLDDCSHDRTPEIIKGFAQEGVRFIKGAEPDERWLAKNHAYDRLTDEANGEIVLFCGVDARFGPETIRALITTMLARDKDMLSVMPRRLTSDVWAAFIQPLRYWWELAIPRRYLNRPSVISTCWLIRRKALKDLGGFKAVSHSILPEGYFAREIVKKSDGYTFVRADDILDVQTRKGLPEQRDTAIRMRYPQVRRRPELVMVLALIEFAFFLGPFALVLVGVLTGFGLVQALAAAACVLLILTHVSIIQVSNPANVLVAAINFPAVVITELYLGIMSMLKYEFSTVEWKGRDVVPPVMHVYPKLPDISRS